MKRKAELTVPILMLLVLWVLPSPLDAQTPAPPSLKEQLEAQFPAGTVLVIQKEGVPGVLPAAGKTCAARYQKGKLDPPDSSCTAPLQRNSRSFAVGEKVYPAAIDVDLANGRISFHLVECGACKQGGRSSGYQSQVDFQFGQGYLESAGISQIEDTISEVLAFEAGADRQPEQNSAAPGQPGEAPAEVLTNSDVVKMVRAKLGDGIVIGTIKASACNFDTSVNAMVSLKESGVSDPVIQAMRDAHEAAKAAPEPVPVLSPEAQQGEAPAPAATPGPVSFSVRHRHRVVGQNFQMFNYYCSGTLSVFADGRVTYDCAQTDDPQGRCDHVSFAPGSLKEAKAGSGRLHLASKTQGNFDLYGNTDDILQAQAAITPLIQTAQR